MLFSCRGVRGDTPGSARVRKSAHRRCMRRDGLAVSLFCAASLADEGQVISFVKERKRSEKALRSFLPLICCPARTADKRAPRPPSCQSPPPKAFPALGIHPASGITSLLVVKRCSMGHNASSIQDYRGIHQFSQPKSLAIRSTPRMQLHVLALSASPRQGVQRKSVRPSTNASLCTHCHDGVVRPDTEDCTKWR